MKALSVREPWASLIVFAGKDIENRTWPTRYRGPLLIHAAKVSTREEFDAAAAVVKSIGADERMLDDCPYFRGGIIGRVDIVDCVRAHTSPWFVGPWGFVLRNPQPVAFFRCRGQLGFFNVGQEPQPIR